MVGRWGDWPFTTGFHHYFGAIQWLKISTGHIGCQASSVLPNSSNLRGALNPNR
jgi:hypothetical protein